MPTARKVAEVALLKELFVDAALIVSTDYRGVDVEKMNGLRAALRSHGLRYRVAKNTLVRIAADEIGRPEIKEVVDGPCGFLVTTGEPTVAAKSLIDHIRADRLELAIRGGVLNGQVISEEGVRQLAGLPSRDVLLARLFCQMNAPVTALVTVLSGPVRALATVLQRHIENREGAAVAEKT